MVELKVYYNFDERQAHVFRARTEETLLAAVERTIHRDGIHNCDGWTLGEPSELAPHVTISFSESAPKEYAWELVDFRDVSINFNTLRYTEATEVGTFEEIFDRFWAFAKAFVHNGNTWEGLT
jgi:hypothetical protein